MELDFIFLSTKEKAVNVDILSDIIENEYSNLSDLYANLFIIIGRSKHVKKGIFEDKIKEIFGESRTRISLDRDPLRVSSVSGPPIACILINNFEYKKFEDWKKLLSIRHECCHLLHPKENGIIFNDLISTYSQKFMGDFIRYRREFCAHLCVIKRTPEDWLTEPLGFTNDIEPPKSVYARERNLNQVHAIRMAIKNIVWIVSIQYLYDNIPKELQEKILKKREYNNDLLYEFFNEVQKDTVLELKNPYTWLNQDDFLSSERYYEVIRDLLRTIN